MSAILGGCVLQWIFNIGAFLLVDPIREPPLMHVCRLYTTSAGCLGDELPPAWKARSIALSVPERGLVAGAWPCSWHDASEHYTSLLCVDDKCRASSRLYELQFAIVTEYACLYFWMVAIMAVVLTIEKIELWDNFKGNIDDEAAELAA